MVGWIIKKDTIGTKYDSKAMVWATEWMVHSHWGGEDWG